MQSNIANCVAKLNNIFHKFVLYFIPHILKEKHRDAFIECANDVFLTMVFIAYSALMRLPFGIH